MNSPPPSFARAFGRDVAESWWVYVFAPLVIALLGFQGWGGGHFGLAYLVGLCATVTIGGTTQGLFFVGQRRGWTLPWGIHNGLFVALGTLVGTELCLALLSLFARIDYASMRMGMWMIGGTAAAVIAAASLAYERLRSHAREVELRAERAKREALQAQLEALRNRMDPHFLFNSLNTIAALIEEDSEAAVDAVERLSELLRHSLARGPEDRAPLADELHIAEGYLELERARFGERLRVDIEVDGGLENVEIPTSMIQPLVENAVKHGVARSREPVTVRVRARRIDAELELEVRDDNCVQAKGPSEGTGTALATLRERLRLAYGQAARFEAGPLAEGGYRACLRVPVEEPSP